MSFPQVYEYLLFPLVVSFFTIRVVLLEMPFPLLMAFLIMLSFYWLCRLLICCFCVINFSLLSFYDIMSYFFVVVRLVMLFIRLFVVSSCMSVVKNVVVLYQYVVLLRLSFYLLILFLIILLFIVVSKLFSF